MSHSSLVRRAASRSPRRAPPPRAPFGAPAGRGSASPSPWGGGTLYPVGVLACCAPLLLPSPSRFALLPSVCPRRVGRAVCFRAALRAALRMRFSFPRGVRRCGAPPSSGRRYAPPPSCAFSLPLARVSLPFFLPRVLSPFRECSCGVFPPAACKALRAVFSAARFAPFRAPPRFLPRFARRVVFMPPRRARKRAGACVNKTRSVKTPPRNVKSEMLKTHRRHRPASLPSLVRFKSVYYLCGVLVMFNFSPLRVECSSTNPHFKLCQKVTCCSEWRAAKSATSFSRAATANRLRDHVCAS